jgi:hypothetical protein
VWQLELELDHHGDRGGRDDAGNVHNLHHRRSG